MRLVTNKGRLLHLEGRNHGPLWLRVGGKPMLVEAPEVPGQPKVTLRSRSAQGPLVDSAMFDESAGLKFGHCLA